MMVLLLLMMVEARCNMRVEALEATAAAAASIFASNRASTHHHVQELLAMVIVRVVLLRRCNKSTGARERLSRVANVLFS